MIEPFVYEEHVTRLSSWLAKHGLRVPDKRLLSMDGFVADKIAIGFLFKGGNSKHAYVDHVAADPNAEKDKRDCALNKLFWHLENLARKDGYLFYTILAQLPTMKTRIKNHGFEQYGDFSLFYKTL